MNSKEDSKYRLKLAKGFLKEARQDVTLRRWRSCVDNAQLSVENAGKTIIAIFEPIAKSHNLASQLKGLVDREIIDQKIIKIVEEILPLAEKFGVEKHIMTDYGDESSYKVPWEIFSKEDAQESFDTAKRCVKAAEKVYHFYFAIRRK